MKKFYTLLFFTLFISSINAQEVGDTIRVKAFDFSSSTRDTVIDFPDLNPAITYEKILLKYTMRCHDAAVNPGDNSTGCGEWDYSCNTYLIDSSKVEQFATTIPSHYISDYDEAVFTYKSTPVFNYNRSTSSILDVTNIISEEEGVIGGDEAILSQSINTENIIGKTHYLFTAEELYDIGMVAGEINAISLEVLEDAGIAKFFEINMKNTVKTELNGNVDLSGFTKVFYSTVQLAPSQLNKFHLPTPFIWDGTSNVLVEFNFTNIDGVNPEMTSVKGEETTVVSGLHNEDDGEIRITNNGYIECDDYYGIQGSQTRTVEMWVKTSDTRNSEICAWGALETGAKWTLRLQGGRLRVEVQGGNTQGSTPINDGAWHHIAIVQDGGTLSNIKFYIDGVLDQNQVTGTLAINTILNETIPLRISRGIQNRYFESVVDEFRLWDTALDQETIANWMRLKLDESHPNNENLQLYYEFNEEGTEVFDSSVYERDAKIVGLNVRMSQTNGAALFKDFSLQKQRPRMHFYQAEYEFNEVELTIDKPIAKEPRHFAIERTIIPGDPIVVKDDEIQVSPTVEIWTVDQTIFDETTGAIIETTELEEDGVINIVDLGYTRRFPFYNELVSFVTPYGFFLDLGPNGETWYMDMSDYVSILNGKRRIQMTLGGQNNEEYDMEFQFIVGTPPRDVVQYDQVWQGTNRIGIARIDQILDDTKFAPYSLPLSADAETFKLKSSITGHGSQGEFQQNGGAVFHNIEMDGEPVFIWDVNRECSFNPIFPQGGTWVYDRQGWCPGERTFMNEQDFTEVATPGEDILIDYYTTAPPVATGDYRYHVAHQVVGYGAPNFNQDAAVVAITAPNNTAEYNRTGNICANPTIVIRNTGATELTELTITYWLNESITPQTYTWTGSLDFMEEEELEIPATAELWFDILESGNVFHAEVSAPNQGEDEYSNNNLMTQSFNTPVIFPTDISIVIRTNFNASENSYELFDAFSGTVVASNNLPVAATTYTDDYELDEGCYKLVVKDTGGDGLMWWANTAQGTGFARITDSEGAILELFEPDFGGGFEFSFNTDFSISVDEFDFLTSIKVYPNPTTDYVTLEADDLEGSNVSVVDMSGRTYKAPIIARNNKTITIDLLGLTSGIYFVLIEKGDVVTTRKVVVE